MHIDMDHENEDIHIDDDLQEVDLLLAQADCVLLLLTADVLTVPASRLQLERAIDEDKHIHAVYSTAAGWIFDGDEHKEASRAVKKYIESQEILAYRAPDPMGPSAHEFKALVRQLLRSIVSI